MIKLGYKYPKSNMEVASTSESHKQETHYPRLDIGSEYGDYPKVTLPVKGSDIGKEITATVKLKVTKIAEVSSEKKSNRAYSFDVLEIHFNRDSDDSKSDRLNSMKKEYGG